MHIALHSSVFFATHLRRSSLAGETPIRGALRTSDDIRRRRALRKVDGALSKRNFETALSLVKQLQKMPFGLPSFGAAKQVPPRISLADKTKLKDMDFSYLQFLVDSIFDSIKVNIQFASLDGVSLERLETLIHDDSDDSLNEKDHLRCLQHEAGHFLVAYLMGVLPHGYKIPSMEALRQDRFTGGRVELVGLGIFQEDNKDRPSSKTLNRFCCITLGGIVAEHLVYGYSKGLRSDVEKLDSMLKSAGLTESEADIQLKSSILNTITILLRHDSARTRLVNAMASGRSVGFCICSIENTTKPGDV